MTSSSDFFSHLDTIINGPFNADWKDFIYSGTMEQKSDTELFELYAVSRKLAIKFPIKTPGEKPGEITMKLIKSWKSIGYILDYAELHPEHCTQVTIRAIHESIITILDTYKKVHKIIEIGFTIPESPENPGIGVRINSRTIIQQEVKFITEALDKHTQDALVIYRKLHSAFLEIFETDQGIKNRRIHYVSRPDVF